MKKLQSHSTILLTSYIFLFFLETCRPLPKEDSITFQNPQLLDMSTDKTPPTIPANFSASSGGSTQINLSWSASTDDRIGSNAIVYEICQNLASAGCDSFIVAATTAAGALNYAMTGLLSNVSYYYRIRAKDLAGNTSAESIERNAATSPAGTVNDPQFNPAAGSYNTSQSISLSSSTTGATTCYTTDGNLPACNNATAACTNGLSYSSAINFSANMTIRALSCKVGWLNSAVITANYVYDTSAPANVTNFSAFNAGDSQINLTWTKPGDLDLAGIRLVRKTGSYPASVNDGTVVYTANGSGFADNSVVNGTIYYYKAFSYDLAGNFASGQQASATPATDTTAPVVVDSIPTDSAIQVPVCSGNPCKAKISVIFSESMNTSLSQNLTTAVYNNSSFITAAHNVTNFTWSTTSFPNDTLNFEMSWNWFMENSRIRYTLAISGLQDANNNPIAAAVQRSFTTGGAALSFAISDSGQSSCYNNSASITCGSDSNFPGQDGDFVNTPQARNFSAPTAHSTYTSDYTTTDNVTGLVWKTCQEGKSGAACGSGSAATYTWYNAINACSTLNAANSLNGYAGRTNWRLPTIVEIETIPHLSNFNPAIDNSAFPATSYSSTVHYWSATTLIANNDNSFYMNFENGYSSYHTKNSSNYVRCVSSGNPTSMNFIDNADGTISDTVTGLRWQKCGSGKNNDASCSGSSTALSWSMALQYCESLGLGSFSNSSNWRLPNAQELKSIVDKGRYNKAIHSTYFPATDDLYWTSTTVPNFMNFSLANNFLYGQVSIFNKANTFSARCVAQGP